MTGRAYPVGDRERTIGQNVRAARQAAGLTQGQLAERLGVTYSTVLNLETARVAMRVGQLLDLARELDVAPEALLAGAIEAQ